MQTCVSKDQVTLGVQAVAQDPPFLVLIIGAETIALSLWSQYEGKVEDHVTIE